MPAAPVSVRRPDRRASAPPRSASSGPRRPGRCFRRTRPRGAVSVVQWATVRLPRASSSARDQTTSPPGSVGPGASHAVSSSNSTHPSKQAPSWPFGRLQRSRAALFSFPHRGRGRRPLVSILMACLTLVGCVRAQGAGARFGLQRAVCGRSSRSRQIEKMSSSLSSSPGSSGDRSVSPRPKVSVGVRAPAR